MGTGTGTGTGTLDLGKQRGDRYCSNSRCWGIKLGVLRWDGISKIDELMDRWIGLKNGLRFDDGFDGKMENGESGI